MKIHKSSVIKATLIGSLGAISLFAVTLAGATDVSRTPLVPSSVAKPNVIFGMDDSGSMDFEVMLNTNDGAFWWNDTTVLNGVTGSGWDGSGVPLFNTAGTSGSGWSKMTYLFPNGCATGARGLCDATGHYGIPPTYQFAWLRSAAFNPLYYDSNVDYSPWTSAYVSSALKTFGAVSTTAAVSHPLYATPTINLSADVALSTAADTTFQARPGMVVPAGAKIFKANAWQVQASTTTLASGVSYNVAMAYYPATFWAPKSCTVDNLTCTKAPDGSNLQRYEIKSGVTFPSGRAYAAELQNFANWFSYSRKRKLMLAASAGLVLNSLTGMRLGLVAFNSQIPVTMYDTDSTDDSKNAKVILGQFFSNAASGGTPTRETLNYIGNQFKSNTNVVTLSCQKNAAFVMTDGFANATTVTPPAYTAATYGNSAPYKTTYAGTLADIALSYYTNNIRSDLKAGTVPSSPPTAANPQNDGNSNLHMNTYAMTLGARGTLWPAVSNAYTSTLSWPNPTVNYSPTAVDDLWHATVNGRGQMFTAKTPLETAASIQTALTNILSTSGAQSAVAFSTVNIKPNEATGFVGSYTPAGWSGDVAAYAVDTATGAMATNTQLWSAGAILQARDYTTRAIGSYTGLSGTTLDDSTNWAALYAAGKFSGTVANFVAYLRGQQTNEGSTYRARTGLIGPVVNAEPASVLADKVVYAASNEGMLHAFDKATGAELWAYVPRFTFSDIAANSKPNVSFSTILDGTPVVAKLSASQTVLVGGRGTAGPGFYALNVANPYGAVGGTGSATQSDTMVGQRALWEFPGTATSPTTLSSLGTATGRPLIVNTARWGWVVLLTSGYNSTLDGKGRVFVLNAITGALLDTIATTSGTLAAEAGLSSISGFQEADGTVKTVYGGDLLGNLWKFNLQDSTVSRLATLTDASNKALPITAAPDLAYFSASGSTPARRMVYVGTGRLLGPTDFTDSSVNTFFALRDNNAEVNPSYAQSTSSTNVRNFLAPRVISVNATTGVRTATGAAIDWTKKSGWYVDLPAGEKANTDPTVGLGVITWTSNYPSLATCSSSSSLYYADAETGLQLSDDSFPNSTPISYGIAFSTTLTSRPIITKLPSGVISITTHQSDNTTRSTNLNGGSSTSNVTSFARKGKVAWKQVLQ